jgi:ATP-dependent DNA helicase RecQ
MELRLTIQQLIQSGYVRQALSEYNVLKLTEKARPLLKGEQKFEASEPRAQLHQTKASGRKTKSDQPTDNTLLTMLKSIRTQLAKNQDVPPFVIFSDASLVDMASRQPKTDTEFLDVHGVGQYKLKKYGDLFLETIANYQQEPPTNNPNS